MLVDVFLIETVGAVLLCLLKTLLLSIVEEKGIILYSSSTSLC